MTAMHDLPTCPVLGESASAKDAIVWLRLITKWIGPGFHPDTPGAAYIRGEDTCPLFTAEEATRFDSDLDRCFELLDAEGRDPYDVAIKVQRRLLRMPLLV